LIERSSAETFRGSSQDAIAEDDVSPEWFYEPMQAQGLVWVAEAGGQLVGFGACEAFADALHLWELAVRHEAQGRGVGRHLIDAAADEARRRELPAMTLSTFRNIPWNAPYYARLGFRMLADHELNDRLIAVLAKETANGLTERCAMRLDL
jgi:ribosomal protein S18 acetylase RimI-like enzyme